MIKAFQIRKTFTNLPLQKYLMSRLEVTREQRSHKTVNFESYTVFLLLIAIKPICLKESADLIEVITRRIPD
jgi:hypothetical protein